MTQRGISHGVGQPRAFRSSRRKIGQRDAGPRTGRSQPGAVSDGRGRLV